MKKRRWLVPWLFLAPALIVFTWFKFVPIVKGLIMSFYKIKFLVMINSSGWIIFKER